MIGAFFGLVALAIAAVVVLVLGVALLAVIVALLAAAVALALKLLPFVFIGWLILRFVRRNDAPRRRVGISWSDREWLDSPSW
jgi:hypothetical protein